MDGPYTASIGTAVWASACLSRFVISAPSETSTRARVQPCIVIGGVLRDDSRALLGTRELVCKGGLLCELVVLTKSRITSLCALMLGMRSVYPRVWALRIGRLAKASYGFSKHSKTQKPPRNNS